MTADLVQFLRDRLYEDERQANAATTFAAASWSIETSGIVTTGPDDDVYTNDREVAAHIARHDPARVLREVEAGRRVLRAHEKWCEGRCEAKYPEGGSTLRTTGT